MRRNVLQWLACSRYGSSVDVFSFLWPAVLLLSMVLVSVSAGAQNETEGDSGPILLSVFPLGGQRGTTVQGEVRGNHLDGASAVWFDKGGLKAQLLKVEEVKDDFKQKVNPLEKQKKRMTVYRALIQVRIDPTARPGIYPLRLV